MVIIGGAGEDVRALLLEAMRGAADALGAADLLCGECVELLAVDGVAVSFVHREVSRGTFGSSNDASRRLDDLQFTLGEGPCLDAVATGMPVLVADLYDPTEVRWPAYRAAMGNTDINAVFAVPVSVDSRVIGALDLFRREPGPLSGGYLAGALAAAELAAQPLLELLTGEIDWSAVAQGEPWPAVSTLERVEVNQATGMIIAALDIGAAEALLRLRAWAFVRGETASEVAFQILDGRLRADLTD